MELCMQYEKDKHARETTRTTTCACKARSLFCAAISTTCCTRRGARGCTARVPRVPDVSALSRLRSVVARTRPWEPHEQHEVAGL